MNEQSYPLITMVLLSYNHAKTIIESLDGIFAQTYPNLEIIISDVNFRGADQ